MVQLRTAVLAALFSASAGRLLAPKDAPVKLAVDIAHEMAAQRASAIDAELARKVTPAKHTALAAVKRATPVVAVAKKATATVKVNATVTANATVKANVTVTANATVEAEKKHNVSDLDQIAKLQEGLKSIEKVRTLFANNGVHHVDSEKFANGALSEELSKQDSQVWVSIEDMLKESVSAMSQMKKLKNNTAEQKKVMASLENQLNAKASVLNNMTAAVSIKQREQDEEYLLGLLIMHQKDWDMKQQLNATATFVKDSPLIKELYEHHDAAKPLATQFAAMLDKVTKSHTVPKAAAKAFIQLASSSFQ